MTMTVGQLIEKLTKKDPNAQVMLNIYEPGEEGFDYVPDAVGNSPEGVVQITALLNPIEED